MKNLYSENHKSLIKNIEKDKKDMPVLELEELVFENIHTTQKFLKIQGDFHKTPYPL